MVPSIVNFELVRIIISCVIYSLNGDNESPGMDSCDEAATNVLPWHNLVDDEITYTQVMVLRIYSFGVTICVYIHFEDNLLTLGYIDVILKIWLSNTCSLTMLRECAAVSLYVTATCHWTSLNRRQHYFRKWLGANRQKAITWANIDTGPHGVILPQ